MTCRVRGINILR